MIAKTFGLKLDMEDQESNVTVTAIVRSIGAYVGLCIFSPEGGECEIFVDINDANRIAAALMAAATESGDSKGVLPANT